MSKHTSLRDQGWAIRRRSKSCSSFDLDYFGCAGRRSCCGCFRASLPAPTTRHEALEILERYKIDVPSKLFDWLESEVSETPKTGDSVFEFSMTRVQNPNLEILALAVNQLGELADDMVFLGGCATGLLISDSAAPPIRVTRDVDAISGHMPTDETSQARVSGIIGTINRISEL